ncbi:MAG: hypothetical protein UX28_C0001G0293 [Candidatus Pacebacteria bacterium GW2011_GWA1_46_10]|nr:MAG: hypothetical protein UX28_C0001G0293 [Candidatus Pacebacteria bacterium GW2011_GWA1_46_10]
MTPEEQKLTQLFGAARQVKLTPVEKWWLKTKIEFHQLVRFEMPALSLTKPAAILLASFILLAAAGVVVAASHTSPGDLLYPLKVASEKVNDSVQSFFGQTEVVEQESVEFPDEQREESSEEPLTAEPAETDQESELETAGPLDPVDLPVEREELPDELPGISGDDHPTGDQSVTVETPAVNPNVPPTPDGTPPLELKVNAKAQLELDL